MTQLVGHKCLLCQRRIFTVLDGMFCPKCHCAVHHACIKPDELPRSPIHCPSCGGNPSLVLPPNYSVDGPKDDVGVIPAPVPVDLRVDIAGIRADTADEEQQHSGEDGQADDERSHADRQWLKALTTARAVESEEGCHPQLTFGDPSNVMNLGLERIEADDCVVIVKWNCMEAVSDIVGGPAGPRYRTIAKCHGTTDWQHFFIPRNDRVTIAEVCPFCQKLIMLSVQSVADARQEYYKYRISLLALRIFAFSFLFFNLAILWLGIRFLAEEGNPVGCLIAVLLAIVTVRLPWPFVLSGLPIVQLEGRCGGDYMTCPLRYHTIQKQRVLWRTTGKYSRVTLYEMDPFMHAYARAFIRRGNARYAVGAYDAAIKDYDEAIRLDPTHAAAFYGRGLAWYFKKEYDRAIRDFDEAIRLVPKDAGAMILGHFAARQRGDHASANRFLNESARILNDSWPYPVIAFLRGRIDERTLLKLATDDGERTEARCYAGLDDVLKGRKNEALAHFRWVTDHGKRRFIEYYIAQAELERLEQGEK